MNTSGSPLSRHPLRDTFTRVSALSPHLTVDLGWQEAQIPAAELFIDPSPVFERMVGRIRGRYQTNDGALLASFFMNAYTWPLVSAGMSCVVIESRLPDLHVEHVAFRLREDSKITSIAFRPSHWYCLGKDPQAHHPRARPLEKTRELQAVFRSQLEKHLETVIDYVRERLPWGKRALWLTAADRCGEALMWLSKHTPSTVLASQDVPLLYKELFSHPASPLKNDLTSLQFDRGGLILERGACCLAYRLPDKSYCQSCPIQALSR